MEVRHSDHSIIIAILRIVGKFLIVLLLAVSVVGAASLAWPRFSDAPRPEPLERINSMLRQTVFGRQAAEVLGVSDDARSIKLSPDMIVESVSSQLRDRATDVIITHASRMIIEKFGTLPEDQQAKILEALTTALNQQQSSPSENLSEASQSGSQGDNNSGNDK